MIGVTIIEEKSWLVGVQYNLIIKTIRTDAMQVELCLNYNLVWQEFIARKFKKYMPWEY